MVDKKSLVKLLQRLIRIDSQNPPGDESAIADFTRQYLQSLGLKARVYEFKKRRTNVVALLPGRNGRHSLLVTPHLDTVPAGRSWKSDPFSGRLRQGRIYGLGATDCKVNLACALGAIKSVVDEKIKLDYDLIFSATADEETGSALGLVPLLDKGILKPQAAIVLDADDFDIVVAQKGLCHLKVKIEGRRAHGAYPHRGVNAIDIAVNIINRIKRCSWPHRANRYLRPPTINVGTIRGGDKVNVVADWCEFELDFRFLPHTSPGSIIKKTKNIIAKFSKKSKIEIESIQQPYAIDPSHNLVTSLVTAMRRNNVEPSITGSEGATVVTFFQRKAIPAVATGFGCAGCAHTSDEFVSVENLVKGAGVLEYFFKNYRGG